MLCAVRGYAQITPFNGQSIRLTLTKFNLQVCLK